MLFPFNTSIRKRFLTLFVFVSTIAITTVGTVSMVWSHTFDSKLFSNSMKVRAEILAENSKAALVFSDQDDATELLRSMKHESDIVHVEISHPDGTKLASTGPQPPSNSNHLTFRAPVIQKGETVGQVTVISSLSSLNQKFRQQLTMIALVGGLALCLSILVGIWAQGVVTRPITNLASITQQVGHSKDYSLRAQKLSGDEIGILVDAFNEMLAQIDEYQHQLEAKVEERTTQLSESNKALEKSNHELSQEIQARQETEDQLIRSERFSVIGTFLQGISHEFNNINGSIIGLSYLATEIGKKDPELIEVLDTMHRSVDKQTKLIKNLLSVSGKGGERMSLTQPARIIEDALSLARFKSKTATFTVHQPKKDGPLVMMDGDQIAQVVLNLIINACDASAGKTKQIIEITLEYTEQNVVFQISDNGCGIPEENRHKVFSPFFTTKGEFSDKDEEQAKIKGNGLGLSICEKIISRHNGTIQYHSEIGKGTTFTIKLPRSPAEETTSSLTEAPATEPESPSHQHEILVVEDQEALRFVSCTFLKKSGFKPLEACHGKEALEILEKHNPSLILLDLNMPIMDGFGFLEVLKSEEKKIRTLILTGLPRDEAERQLEGLPYENIYSKPVDMKSLCQTLVDEMQPG
jgi:signal transduction histidine kinase